MNPFLLSPKGRLDDWKNFRKSLANLPENEQLKQVALYWAQAPMVKIAYDLDQPENIPSAWEMVSAGSWCENSVAIGMEFTLRLAGIAADRLQLALIRDYDISEMKVILIVDGTFALNYEYGEVTTIPSTNHDVLGWWQFTGKTYSIISA